MGKKPLHYDCIQLEEYRYLVLQQQISSCAVAKNALQLISSHVVTAALISRLEDLILETFLRTTHEDKKADMRGIHTDDIVKVTLELPYCSRLACRKANF